MQFCTTPTGPQPPRPSVAKAGSDNDVAVEEAASTRVSFTDDTGIAGGSGIVDNAIGVLSWLRNRTDEVAKVVDAIGLRSSCDRVRLCWGQCWLVGMT